jgi:hypothetical protein
MLMQEYHGVSMNAGKASFWATEIRLSAPDGCGANTTDAEIEAAIRFALRKTATDRGRQRPRAANLNDLIMWVRWMRKEERDHRLGIDPDAEARTCEDFKARMLAADNYTERWFILCRAPYRMCIALEQWATDRWGQEFARAKAEDHKLVAAECRAAIEMIENAGALVVTGTY